MNVSEPVTKKRRVDSPETQEAERIVQDKDLIDCWCTRFHQTSYPRLVQFAQQLQNWGMYTGDPSQKSKEELCKELATDLGLVLSREIAFDILNQDDDVWKKAQEPFTDEKDACFKALRSDTKEEKKHEDWSLFDLRDPVTLELLTDFVEIPEKDEKNPQTRAKALFNWDTLTKLQQPYHPLTKKYLPPQSQLKPNEALKKFLLTNLRQDFGVSYVPKAKPQPPPSAFPLWPVFHEYKEAHLASLVPLLQSGDFKALDREASNEDLAQLTREMKDEKTIDYFLERLDMDTILTSLINDSQDRILKHFIEEEILEDFEVSSADLVKAFEKWNQYRYQLDATEEEKRASKEIVRLLIPMLDDENADVWLTTLEDIFRTGGFGGLEAFAGAFLEEFDHINEMVNELQERKLQAILYELGVDPEDGNDESD